MGILVLAAWADCWELCATEQAVVLPSGEHDDVPSGVIARAYGTADDGRNQCGIGATNPEILDAAGHAVAGEETQEVTQTVFRPARALTVGETYTVPGYHDSGATLLVDDTEVTPPSAPPELLEGTVERIRTCEPWRTLSASVSAPTSAPAIWGLEPVLHVFHLDGPDDTGLEPSWTGRFSHFGDGSWRWRDDGPAEECFRLIEEDVAGNRSEPSEVYCVPVTCGCAATPRSPQALLTALLAAGLRVAGARRRHRDDGRAPRGRPREE